MMSLSNKHDWISDDEIEKLLGSTPQEDTFSDDDLLTLSDQYSELHYEEPSVPIEAKKVVLEELTPSHGSPQHNIDFQVLQDVTFEVRVLLGSAEMTIEEFLEKKVDSVIKLSKLAGEPVDLLIGDLVFAKGETVIMEDRFGVLITEIVPLRERVKTVEKKVRTL